MSFDAFLDGILAPVGMPKSQPAREYVRVHQRVILLARVDTWLSRHIYDGDVDYSLAHAGDAVQTPKGIEFTLAFSASRYGREHEEHFGLVRLRAPVPVDLHALIPYTTFGA